jgi:flagellar hook-basal body complex protein FliE
MIAAIGESNGALRTGLSSEFALPTVSSTSPAQSVGEDGFGKLFKDALGQVDQLQDEAHTAVRSLISGTGVDVHQAMIATEKASMAFDLALAVRNKAIQSYQSIMSMQF